MSCWFREDKRTWTQKLATYFLSQGAIPKHVAFILDGNRTYAKKQNVSIADGNKAGHQNSTSVFNWCRNFGVEEMTTYLFSIENFSRPWEQICRLHMAFKEVFTDLLMSLDELHEDGIQIRVIGDWKLMHASIIHLLAKLMHETKDNKGLIINFAYCYTSRNEMLRAAMEIENGIRDSSLDIDDITVDLLDKIIQVQSVTRPVDLVIRTSGVTRLSDFLLWQSSFATLYFTEVLWPDLSFWDICKAIYFYQRQISKSSWYQMISSTTPDIEYKPAAADQLTNGIGKSNNGRSTQEEFLKEIEFNYWAYIKSLADEIDI